MEYKEIENLRYRRQYLLVPEEVKCPFTTKSIIIVGQYKLYTQTDLVVTESKTEEKHLILLGDIFDFNDPGISNSDILHDLSKVSFQTMLKMTDLYSGRFVLIYCEKTKLIILHDATAARKVYYSKRSGQTWFSSQQHLLAKVMGLRKTENPSKLEFYNSDDFILHHNSNLGNTSYYDEIEQLMANHYFELESKRIVRFWPSEPFISSTFREVSEKCTTILSGYLQAIAKRYKIMLPVTAGCDSRLLMSATRDFNEDVFYYINQSKDLSKESTDIRISSKLFRQLDMKFNVLPMPTEIEKSFENLYFQNNPIASRFYLPHIYNYYLNYSDRVNLPGNIAAAPWGIYHMNGNTVTIDEITRYYQVHKFEYVQAYYRNWMDEVRDLCRDCKMNVINLFYWEERITNWGNQISIDKDIAQEDFNPLNSRILNELFLSLPIRYNNEPDKKIQRRIIKNLWPELMRVPFNPSPKTSAMMLLSRLELFTPVARTLYKTINQTKHL